MTIKESANEASFKLESAVSKYILAIVLFTYIGPLQTGYGAGAETRFLKRGWEKTDKIEKFDALPGGENLYKFV